MHNTVDRIFNRCWNIPKIIFFLTNNTCICLMLFCVCCCCYIKILVIIKTLQEYNNIAISHLLSITDIFSVVVIFIISIFLSTILFCCIILSSNQYELGHRRNDCFDPFKIITKLNYVHYYNYDYFIFENQISIDGDFNIHFKLEFSIERMSFNFNNN